MTADDTIAEIMLSTHLGTVWRWLRYDRLLTAALAWFTTTVVVTQFHLTLGTLIAGLVGAGGLVVLWSAPLDRYVLGMGIIACLAVSWVSWKSLATEAVVLDRPIEFSGSVVELPAVFDRSTRLTVRVLDSPTVPMLVGRKVTLDVDAVPPTIAGIDIRTTVHPIAVGATTARLDRVRGLVAHFATPAVTVVGVDRTVGGRLTRLRALIVERVSQLWREPAASLAAGLVVGNRANFDPNLAAAMQRTGTTHLVAVSGENLVVVLWFLTLLLPARPGWLRTTLKITALTLFAVVAGGSASVVRAVLLVAAVTLSRDFGRPVNGLRVLVLVAWLMAVLNPYLPVFDLGFQLSFTAVAGLLTFAPWISRRIPGPRSVRTALSVATAAYLTTAPILAGSFGLVSLSAPVVNLLLQPLTFAAMAGSAGAIGLSAISSTLGHLAAWTVWPLLAAIIGLIQWFARQSIPVLSLAPPAWLVWFVVAVLVLAPAWSQLQSDRTLDDPDELRYKSSHEWSQ